MDNIGYPTSHVNTFFYFSHSGGRGWGWVKNPLAPLPKAEKKLRIKTCHCISITAFVTCAVIEMFTVSVTLLLTVTKIIIIIIT